jgi:hypothetical protein
MTTVKEANSTLILHILHRYYCTEIMIKYK